jgi:formylglycine-generating enzyme required for sulfatase activity
VITVDAYGKENGRRRHYAHFFPEDLGNGIVLEMVYIPGGTFMMGSPATEERREDNESPQHQVTVPAFYAGKYPITQAQWQAVMGNNPSYFKGEKRPVETVSWDDAVEFCGKLSQQTGKKYRLLSEAEWEYACRAGTTTPFHFGETITSDLVNHNGSSPYETPKDLTAEKQPMSGVFPPMPLGCTICTAMFGNGAAMSGTKTITAHQLTEVPGNLAQIIPDCCVAVPGPTVRSFAAVPFASGTGRSLKGGAGVFA